mmetsp:Transcript_31600/g.62084  ORF Transcript_31600/g.62084 Transcript_31600/m.62084 type:complete len:279 (+) Transcript_31600:53-889(+)|eukprot:CAMPEP_0172669726 /NCGR_PEP_ID=MMETSP1074-20121228/9863_1 /TAXON_ID=2916 /ORGANISM="Ceratium fusus, Strain PA161109" /LENGTH=278 /DNA_ID=CAMNT_0013486541 /DNA_START=30 /DNA_END=866 /DNA_ORIENTATION=-
MAAGKVAAMRSRRRGATLGAAICGITAAWLVVHSGTAWMPTGAASATSRRQLLSGLMGAAAPLAGVAEAVRAYDLPPLPYDYDALEPSIDKLTMQLHHDKHHAAYIKKANAALEGKTPVSLLELQKTAMKAGPAIRNNGGGAYNHDLFWVEMAPKGKGGSPSPELAKAIDASFGSFDDFKKKFGDAAANRFGAGWGWLVVSDGKLAITSTPNQDNPLMEGVDGTAGIPILGIDVWEHAYYKKYENRRPEYISAWWDVVNWNQVNTWYENALKGKAVSF